MNVILLESIQNLGKLGDTVKVKPGFARNYLVPHGKAVAATTENLQEFESRRAELEQRQADAFAAAEAKAAALDGVSVTIARKAGDEGKLFGSVVANDIAAALEEAGVEVEKQNIRLVDGPLRQAGEHTVGVRLHADVDASITVHVVPET